MKIKEDIKNLGLMSWTWVILLGLSEIGKLDQEGGLYG